MTTSNSLSDILTIIRQQQQTITYLTEELQTMKTEQTNKKMLSRQRQQRYRQQQQQQQQQKQQQQLQQLQQQQSPQQSQIPYQRQELNQGAEQTEQTNNVTCSMSASVAAALLQHQHQQKQQQQPHLDQQQLQDTRKVSQPNETENVLNYDWNKLTDINFTEEAMNLLNGNTSVNL